MSNPQVGIYYQNNHCLIYKYDLIYDRNIDRNSTHK